MELCELEYSNESLYAFLLNNYMNYVVSDEDEKHEIFEKLNAAKLQFKRSALYNLILEINTKTGEDIYFKNLSSPDKFNNLISPYLFEIIAKGWNCFEFTIMEYIDYSLKGNIWMNKQNMLEDIFKNKKFIDSLDKIDLSIKEIS